MPIHKNLANRCDPIQIIASIGNDPDEEGAFRTPIIEITSARASDDDRLRIHARTHRYAGQRHHQPKPSVKASEHERARHKSVFQTAPLLPGVISHGLWSANITNTPCLAPARNRFIAEHRARWFQ
jgi:hypothetical protein